VVPSRHPLWENVSGFFCEFRKALLNGNIPVRNSPVDL
jgi:hypothetical protein